MSPEPVSAAPESQPQEKSGQEAGPDGAAKSYPYALKLDTKLSEPELRERLDQWSPWSSRIDFSNGLSTADLRRRQPFSDAPLRKLARVEAKVPFEQLRGGSVLDIGCNAGYNSIWLAQRYGMRPTGVDVVKRLIGAARFLADTAGIKAEFVQANAEEFRKAEKFDLVLHFGTLYHLPNPIRSLISSYASLKPGGYIALETQCYDHPADENLCYFMHMQNDDVTNFWALSPTALRACMGLVGFEGIDECFRVERPQEHMYRIVFAARKPLSPERPPKLRARP